MIWLEGYGLKSPAGIGLSIAYMFMPATMAVVTQKAVLKSPLRGSLGLRLRPNRWFLVAWLLPALLILATWLAGLLVPGVGLVLGRAEMIAHITPPNASPEALRSLVPVHPLLIIFLKGLFAGGTINLLAALGEEVGWRGFLLRELGFLGFRRASLTIGVVWGLWHAPLILQGLNYPQHPVAGVFMMVAMTTLATPLMVRLRLKSGSVLAPALFHGVVNAFYDLPRILSTGGSDLVLGLGGGAGLAVLAVICALSLWPRGCQSTL